MNINILSGCSYPEEIAPLFSEYTQHLMDNSPEIAEYLSMQNYDEEVKHLEHKYAEPYGRLYIVFCDGKAAGCIGLRKMDSQRCEMKRFYVRPEFRGHRIGHMLIEKIIDDAKTIGYSHMLLDTLPFLESAIHLYQSYGFYEIPIYNDNPIESSIYMQLEL